MIQRGFTVVELIITITIMGILLLLTVVNVNASQIGARDDERTGDVQAIALALESYYTTGTNASSTLNRYPSLSLVADAASMKTFLPNIDTRSLMAPGVTSAALTFIAATNNVQTIAGVTPQPTVSQYVYQPIMSDGSLCSAGNTECRKYNIFYRLEKDNAVTMVTSKNQ